MAPQAMVDSTSGTDLLAALHLAQEQNGYLSDEALAGVAAQMGLSVQEVYSMASFYKLYNMKPVGKYVLQVCDGLSCFLTGGAERLADYLEGKLGVKAGETTPDGLFTVETVPCLAACGTSPAMRVNDQLYENLTTDAVDDILENLRG